MTDGSPCCQVCAQAALRAVERFTTLPRITSDCRAHPAGGRLYVCQACGAVQKLVDADWLAEIAGIYADYQAYYQAGGDEQIVFDRASGQPRRRSEVLVQRLAADLLPATGRVLDVGCGNGATLRAMSAALSGWQLNGFEISDTTLSRLQTIPRFARLYSGALSSVDKGFDLVCMVHALEHFSAPLQTLQELQPAVGRGQLFIEVCNIEENPFDILVADHLMHFSPQTLQLLLQRAGFSTRTVSTEWVAKEISLLAQAEATAPTVRVSDDYAAHTHARMDAYVNWLDALLARGRALAGSSQSFGVFGTSIAASWLGAQLAEQVAFYVDEDTSRIGREHLGRPILAPEKVPAGAEVYLALSPRIAASIAQRLAGRPWACALPPDLAL